MNKRGTLKVCVLLAVASAFTAVIASNEPATVGEFLVEVAEVRGIDATSPSDSVRWLRHSGWAIPDLDFDAPLTESVIVTVGRAAGIRIKTTRPDATVSASETSSVIVALRPSRDEGAASADGFDGNGADPLTKGKGLKKGILKRVSPSEPI